jgi:membrane protein DedA with SNARE-associated domain
VTVLASTTSFLHAHNDWALPLMFALVALESFGLPLPGETALIACGVIASQGDLSIVAVIVVAAAAAIIGDNLGYVAARKGGRKLLMRYRVTRGVAERYLPRGERFFAKHGGKAVFLGRFVAVLRVTAAWCAGLARMHWWSFLGWNAAGGIVWATLIGLLAYYLGEAVAKLIGPFGLIAAGGVVLIAAAGFFIARRLERRVLDEE